MRKIIFVSKISVLLCAAPLLADECGDILRDQGAFNIEYVSENGSGYASFKAWQCSSAFNSHDEAREAGVDIGVPIYGVPIEIGGNWEETQRSAWKEENCSAVDQRDSFEASTLKYLRTASPIIATSWATCMKDRAPISVPLECKIERVGNSSVFVASWRRSVGDNDPPRVLSWLVSGGNCQPGFAVNEVFTEGARQSVCTRNEKQDFVAMLETQRGSCWVPAPYEPTKRIFSNRYVLTSPETIRSEIVEFQPEAEIVTNGFPLAIVADDTIVLQGDARIKSFIDRGENQSIDGRSAGSIILQAPKIAGAVLHIENFGEAGLKPSDVARPPKAARGQKGEGGIWKNLQGCVEKREAGPGAPGTQGYKGATGGTGGKGGDVTINIPGGITEGALQHIVVHSTKGGEGGPPGNPGLGGEGGDGGEQAGPRSNVCDGVGPGNKGDEGPSGPPGDPGRAGEDGQVLIIDPA